MFERYPDVIKFLTPQHPKTSVAPTERAVVGYMDSGWWGQRKIDGRRAQIHVEGGKVELWTRQGTRHTWEVPEQVKVELRRYCGDRRYTVLDGEWADGRIYLFDILRDDQVLLNQLNYRDRYERLLLPFISPVVQLLPILKTTKQCLAELRRDDPLVEGLVFRDPGARGWFDGAIVRCRRKGTKWSLTST